MGNDVHPSFLVFLHAHNNFFRIILGQLSETQYLCTVERKQYPNPQDGIEL